MATYIERRADQQVELVWRNMHRKTGVCQCSHLMLLTFLVFEKIHGGSLLRKQHGKTDFN